MYFDVSVLFAPRQARKPPAGEVRAFWPYCCIFLVARAYSCLANLSVYLNQCWCAALGVLRGAQGSGTPRGSQGAHAALQQYLEQVGHRACLRHAWRQHTSAERAGVTCRRCRSCLSRSRLAARARCLTSCWRRRDARSCGELQQPFRGGCERWGLERLCRAWKPPVHLLAERERHQQCRGVRTPLASLQAAAPEACGTCAGEHEHFGLMSTTAARAQPPCRCRCPEQLKAHMVGAEKPAYEGVGPCAASART